MKVLVTGAAGLVASQLLSAFRRRYDLVLLDVKAEDRNGRRVDGVQTVNLMDRERSRYAQHFEGVDRVVHLARKPFTGVSIDQYHYEKAHVDLAYNVYRAAYDADVPRVIAASSVRAAEWYMEGPIRERKMEVIDPYTLALSTNFYGWAKAAYEHMGFLFASGAFGRKMGVVIVRISAPGEVKAGRFDDDPSGYKRSLALYVSPRDLTQLFVKAIETPNINKEDGVPWHVVNGVSDNTRTFVSLANARHVLGYHPEDDSEVRYSQDVQEALTGPGHPGRVQIPSP